MVRDYAGYIFDLDGTLYLGDHLIDGALETLADLRRQGKRVLFLTNKPIATRADYAQKLNALGIPCDPAEVINSTYVMARHLARTAPHARLLVIGEAPLLADLQAEGLTVTSDPYQADIVVVSWDRDFHYRKLDAAYQAVIRGARTVATNPDRTCPMPGGHTVPDAGSMIGALEGCTGKPLDLNVGKPSRIMLDIALERLQLPTSLCLMIGDRIETDIRMGAEAGMDTALVLTGITKKEDLARYPYRPTYVLSNVAELTRATSTG